MEGNFKIWAKYVGYLCLSFLMKIRSGLQFKDPWGSFRH